jgi:biotin carboxyl carrier protein
MENNVIAEKAGKVTQIKVQPGQTVGAGDVVAIIE